jgi:UDP-3-O-[3-hydroxymyristoyl] glucosamine N-acyltransferase
MLIANQKPICLIGYAPSTLTQEAYHFLSQEHSEQVFILEPNQFVELDNKQQYQYGVAFTLDQQLRKHIIDMVDNQDLDCIRYVHDTVVCYTPDVSTVIGRGSFVSPFSTLLLGSKIGNHCIVETYCLISHYSELGNNVQMHSGTMIAGRTQIGNDCVFNFRSSVLNALTLCDGIEVGATSTVTKNLERTGRYVGTPARYVGELREFDHV